MGLRWELFVTLLGAMLLNAILAFGAVGLLSRMGPAIERILERNMRSIAAVTDMLEVLAESEGHTVDSVQQERLQKALKQAQANVSEPGEDAVVRDVASGLRGDLLGERRKALVSKLHALRQLNFEAMTHSDIEARRLSWAGGWAAALVGFLSFLLGLSILARLRRRVVDPLEELEQVLAAAQQGELQRRCSVQATPAEVERVMRSLNELLDDYHRLRQGSSPQEEHTLERLALHVLMERQPDPTALLSGDGMLVRANQPMLEALAAEGGAALRDALVDPDEAAHGELETIQLPEDSGALCFLRFKSAPIRQERGLASGGD